jgi:hypothetical protein
MEMRMADGDARWSDAVAEEPGSEGLLSIYCGAVKRCAPVCLKNCLKNCGDEDGAEPPCYRVVGYDSYLRTVFKAYGVIRKLPE